jgi:RHS repeat-associated protein
MLQAGRSKNAGGYRFGFNGMEQTKGVQGDGAGTFYDYKNRDYDPWIIRFKRTDALEAKYPFYSPYQFAGNSPILYIDLDGLEPSISPSNSELWRNNIKNLKENKNGSLSYTVQGWQIYQKQVENMNILYQYLDSKNDCEWKELYHTGNAANEQAQSMIGFSTAMSNVVSNTAIVSSGFGEIGLVANVLTRPTLIGAGKWTGLAFTKGTVSAWAQYWTNNHEVDLIDMSADAILPMNFGAFSSSAFNLTYNFNTRRYGEFQSIFSSGENNISTAEFQIKLTNGLLWGRIGDGAQALQKYVYMTEFKITNELLEKSGVGLMDRAHLFTREHSVGLYFGTVSEITEGIGVDNINTKKH